MSAQFVFFWLPHLACGVLPDQELKLCPVCWERRVLTTRGLRTGLCLVRTENPDPSGTLLKLRFQNQAPRCTVRQHGLGAWEEVLGKDWRPRKRGT